MATITLPSTGLGFFPNTFKNLKITNGSTANSQMTVTADALVLVTTANTYLVASAVSVTIDSSTSGVNGLDTGSLAASTWYYLWIISNGTTAAGLMSLSSTAPTLPGGYTYASRVGSIYTDASSYFMRIFQIGTKVNYNVIAGTNTAAMPSIITGVHGDTDIPTWYACSVSSVVPPTAASIHLMGFSYQGDVVIAAPSNAYGAYLSPTNPPLIGGYGQGSITGWIPGSFLLQGSTIYYAGSSTNSGLFCAGWEENL